MTTPTPPTTAERAPRRPTDRKPPKSDLIQGQTLPPLGHDLIKAVSTLRSGEIAETQATILELLEEIGIDVDADPDEEQEIKTTPAVIRSIGRLAGVLEQSAVDPDAFVKFDTGKGAQERITSLAMWYFGELGESESSAS